MNSDVQLLLPLLCQYSEICLLHVLSSILYCGVWLMFRNVQLLVNTCYILHLLLYVCDWFSYLLFEGKALSQSMLFVITFLLVYAVDSEFSSVSMAIDSSKVIIYHFVNCLPYVIHTVEICLCHAPSPLTSFRLDAKYVATFKMCPYYGCVQ